ncbi:MAG: hypothetical protein OEY52_05815 [Gammaproteobacteria bacterium]|nr:hypothetical protein [Gammaproteobacteria bacterium]
MIESLKLLFDTLSSAAGTVSAFSKVIKGTKGDSRALLEEIKENAGLCWLVVEKDLPPEKVIRELASREYDRLLRTEFDFNVLKRKRIRTYKEIKHTELSGFAGKTTEVLLVNIYDKLKELKRIERIDKNTRGIRWRVRIINLQKRILLLLRHLSDR